MIILYSSDCPKCKTLKSKLDQKKINYQICNDIELMIKKHFLSLPLLEVDNKIMNYTEAIKWVMLNA